MIRVPFICPSLFLSCLLCLAACANVPPLPNERFFDDFVIVKIEENESFSSLATEYLNDPEKGWQIAEFNSQTSLIPGQELVIPLIPFNLGGLKADGYQVVPILTYTRFSQNSGSPKIVSESDFRTQMQYLKENGYQTITLEQLLDFLDFKRQIPEKSIVITLDDGRRSVYDIAFPVLRDLGFQATLFIQTDFIGGKQALSWDQIQKLSKNGFDIQSKTRTGRNLTKPNPGESLEVYFKAVQTEIALSKRIIETKLKKSCQYLAYPAGETNPLVIALLKKEGYRAAFTSKEGSNAVFVNHGLIHRSEIKGRLTIEQFKSHLSVFSPCEMK